MPTCEDFPCCGHEAGECPRSQVERYCLDCGEPLPNGRRSSRCKPCIRDAISARREHQEDHR